MSNLSKFCDLLRISGLYYYKTTIVHNKKVQSTWPDHLEIYYQSLQINFVFIYLDKIHFLVSHQVNMHQKRVSKKVHTYNTQIKHSLRTSSEQSEWVKISLHQRYSNICYYVSTYLLLGL